MASRKWRLVFGLAVVLLVGWFVGTQSITRADEDAPEPTLADPGVTDAAAALSRQIEEIEQQRLHGQEQQARAEEKLQELNKHLDELRTRLNEKVKMEQDGIGDDRLMIRQQFTTGWSPPASSRITWEYKSAHYTDDDANALGKEGWELVTVYAWGGEGGGAIKTNAVYKRPVDANVVQPMQQGFQKGMNPWEWGYQTTEPIPALGPDPVPTSPGVPQGAVRRGVIIEATPADPTPVPAEPTNPVPPGVGPTPAILQELR